MLRPMTYFLPSFFRPSFTGKETDCETGLSYFGARYYDPTLLTSWTAVDPMADKYPSLSPYNYCAWNPMNLVDLDGEDPIYAKNFWGKVKRIGDDGENNSRSYLVRGSVARAVKSATKDGHFYSGDLSESINVMHIPTGQIIKDVQKTVSATINSGISPETRVEYGGHSLKGDENARIWDAGTKMNTSTSDGITKEIWSVTPFKINGKTSQVGGPTCDIEFFWHVHPMDGVPSENDKSWAYKLKNNGFTGNLFLIDANHGQVIFFDEKGELMNVKYNDFIKMGNQEQL